MKKQTVILTLLGLMLGLGGTAQQFVDKAFVGCGLDYEVITTRLSLRAQNSSESLPMDSMPVDIDVQIHQDNRDVLKVYLFASLSGTDVDFNPIVRGVDSVNHIISYIEKETDDDPCWSYAEKNLLTYDITDLVSKNGVYQFSGFPLSATLTGTDTDGLMLLIIYSDPFESFIGSLNFSKGVIASNLEDVSYTINNINVGETSTNAEGFVLVADLQDQGSKISVNNGSLFGVPVEEFWDFETKATAVLQGQTSSAFKLSSPNDCAHLLMTGLYFRQERTEQTPLLSQSGDTLEAPSASNYEWFLVDSLLPSIDSIIVPTAPGSYKAIIEDADGCKFESDVIEMVCFENYVPEITTAGRKLTVSKEFSSYQWYRNDTLISGAITDSLYANDSARYYVQIIDTLGCYYQSNEVVFSSINNIVELDKSNLYIYPNPSNGVFTLKLEGDARITELRILDVTGALVFEKTTTNNLSQFQIALSSGVYVVFATDNAKKQFVEKLVVR